MFLGVAFSHRTMEVAISARTREKIENTSAPTTLREWMAAAALFGYAGRVLGVPLAPRFVIYKFLRRRGAWPLDLPVCSWNCALDALAAWKRELLDAPPRRVTTPLPDEIVLFTDACPKGWGAFWFENAQLNTAGADFEPDLAWGTFGEEEAIAVLEARALEYGLARVRPCGLLRICIDNAALAHVLRRGWSRSFALNTVCARILEGLGRHAAHEVLHIASAKNVADALSRSNCVSAKSGLGTDRDSLTRAIAGRPRSTLREQSQAPSK